MFYLVMIIIFNAMQSAREKYLADDVNIQNIAFLSDN